MSCCQRFSGAIQRGEVQTKRFTRRLTRRSGPGGRLMAGHVTETLTLYMQGRPDGDVLLVCPYCGKALPDADKVQAYTEQE